MNDFIKVTRTEDSDGGEIWVSKYQIVYMEPDERHHQTIIQLSNVEIKVIESIEGILNQLDK